MTIDPGHGGNEKGAVHGGVVEAELALQIAKKLHRRLSKDKRFKVQLLRNSDTTLELESRVNRSEKFNADLFISLHANANPNPKARGTEFYIQNQLDAEEEALFLAHTEHSVSKEQEKRPKDDVDAILFDLQKSHKILKSYQVSSYLRKRWTSQPKKMIRQGPFYVLSQNQIPAVLIEVGYLSNPKERKQLTQISHQNRIVKKIHGALRDYAKNMDKLPSGILKPQNAKTR